MMLLRMDVLLVIQPQGEVLRLKAADWEYESKVNVADLEWEEQ